MGNRTVTLDRLFEVLTEQRRRYVLYYFNEHETAVATVDDLAAQLSTWEREWEDRTDQPPERHRENLRIDLHHVHLPDLADAGLIDYDARSQTARSHLDASLRETMMSDEHECPRLETLFSSSTA